MDLRLSLLDDSRVEPLGKAFPKAKGKEKDLEAKGFSVQRARGSPRNVEEDSQPKKMKKNLGQMPPKERKDKKERKEKKENGNGPRKASKRRVEKDLRKATSMRPSRKLLMQKTMVIKKVTMPEPGMKVLVNGTKKSGQELAGTMTLPTWLSHMLRRSLTLRSKQQTENL